LSGRNGRNNGVDDGTVIELGAKRCPTCGVPKGETHLDGCTRSPERMRRLVQIRQEKIARGESVARGGRRRKLRLTEAELEELKVQSAGEMLYGDRAEALAVLRKQLKSKDERVAQNAAKLEILAYTDGTPTQKIEQTTDNVTRGRVPLGRARVRGVRAGRRSRRAMQRVSAVASGARATR
jgi:uncharacterized Zn finger protein (UPF0148 family)